MNAHDALKNAILVAGGTTSLARRLKITPPTVSQWASGLRQIPALRCIDIERATEGAVRCEDLRPDIDWSVLRCPAPREAA